MVSVLGSIMIRRFTFDRIRYGCKNDEIDALKSRGTALTHKL